jgi:uncharacterized membrane protein YeaQ/YmgE (transglycosylase-associated protein family)
MSILVLLAIWIVIGLVVGLLAGSIWKGERPYGEMVDYGLSIVLAVLMGLVDWYPVADLFNLEGLLRFFVAVLEPPFASLIGLWVLRKVKK